MGNETAPDEILELVVCDCKKGKCSEQCQYILLKVSCTDICKCKDECHNEVLGWFFICNYMWWRTWIIKHTRRERQRETETERVFINNKYTLFVKAFDYVFINYISTIKTATVIKFTNSFFRNFDDSLLQRNGNANTKKVDKKIVVTKLNKI